MAFPQPPMKPIRRLTKLVKKVPHTMLDRNQPAERPNVERLPRHNPPRSQPTIAQIDVDAFDTSKNASPPPETKKARNIVIFGESGVGKSSLINMLAGRKTADTSNSVLGCTFQSRQYKININGEDVNVWDTAGLDEGTRGRVTPEAAEKYLTKLLRELGGANGVHLLVYCIRGPSVRKSLARNYVIFYSAICRKKVPIVAVVTGLENEPTSMDNWWIRGERELAKYKMRFDAHACVTTIDMEKLEGTIFEDRSKVSQQAVQKLIIDNCHRAAIRSSSDPNIFVKAALHDFRSMVKSGWENAGSPSSVVFCQTDIHVFHTGVFGDLRQIQSQINGRAFTFHYAGDLSKRYINHRFSKGGADLLIFVGKWTYLNWQKFLDFYASCNGEVCPLLVVTDVDSIDMWMTNLSNQGISGARVESLHTDRRTPEDLSSYIDQLCLVRGTIKQAKGNLLRYLGLKLKANAGDGTSMPHD